MLNNSSSSSINLTSIMFAKYPTTTIASQKVSWFQLCLGRWLSDESSQIVAPIFNTLNLIISKAIFWNYCIGKISFFFCYSDLPSNIFLLLWQNRCKYSCQTDQTYPLLISISQYYKLCLELRKIKHLAYWACIQTSICPGIPVSICWSCGFKSCHSHWCLNIFSSFGGHIKPLVHYSPVIGLKWQQIPKHPTLWDSRK